MKIWLLGIILLLYSKTLPAQCKYSVDKKDDFNKGHTIVTSTDRVGIFNLGEPQLYMSLGRFEFPNYTAYGVWVKLDLMKRNTCFSQNSKLLLMDTDGMIYEMPFSGELTCATQTSSDKYYVSGFFDTNSEELAILSKKQIEKVKIVTTDASFDIMMRTNNDGYGVRWFERIVPCIVRQ